MKLLPFVIPILAAAVAAGLWSAIRETRDTRSWRGFFAMFVYGVVLLCLPLLVHL